MPCKDRKPTVRGLGEIIENAHGKLNMMSKDGFSTLRKTANQKPMRRAIKTPLYKSVKPNSSAKNLY